MPIEAEITILIAIIGMIIACYLLLNYRIGKESNANATQASEIKTLFINLDKVEAEVKALSDKRMDDNIKFTEALAKLNNTLTRFDATLANLDKTLDKGVGELGIRLQRAERTITQMGLDVQQLKLRK